MQALTPDSETESINSCLNHICKLISRLVSANPTNRHYRVSLTMVSVLDTEEFERLQFIYTNYGKSDQARDQCLQFLQRIQYTVDQAVLLCRKANF